MASFSPSTSAALPPPPPLRLTALDKIWLGLLAFFLIVGAGYVVVVFEDPQLLPCSHTCPSGLTPVGAALTIQNATGSCGPSGASSQTVCTYSFHLLVYANGTNVPSASDLSFTVTNATGNSVSGGFRSVTLITSSGCSVGLWNTTRGAWGTTSNPLACRNASIADPIVGGEELVLDPVPDSTLSLSGQGYHLIAVANGPGVTGTTNGYWGAIP